MHKIFYDICTISFFILFVGKSTSVTRTRAQRVAFFVGLNNNINGVQNDEDAKFENVITNIGACYNPETGRFRVPVDGVYQFNIAVAAQGRHKVHMYCSHKEVEYMTSELLARKTSIYLLNF